MLGDFDKEKLSELDYSELLSLQYTLTREAAREARDAQNGDGALI